MKIQNEKVEEEEDAPTFVDTDAGQPPPLVHGGDCLPLQLLLTKVQLLHQTEPRLAVVATHHVQLVGHRRRRHVAALATQALGKQS